MSNILFQNAMQKKAQSVPPVWMMRQAGRYHKHYQRLKEKYTFEDLCKNPELAAKTAMGPIEDFDFDVAILFSDILFPLEALGMNLRYNPGPQFDWNLQTLADFELLLPVKDALRNLEFQKNALKITRSMLPDTKSLIGFVGGPYTLYSYATTGKHSGKDAFPLMAREMREKFMPLIQALLKENIQLQLDGGAEAVMIFDTAAGSLSPAMFREIVMPGIKYFTDEFPGKIGYYALSVTNHHLDIYNEIENLAGFGVDHRFQIEKLLKDNQGNGFLQGNFDQSLLFLTRDDFTNQLHNFLRPIKEMSIDERIGWVCGLGHGVLPGTPEDHVKLFVEIVRETLS